MMRKVKILGITFWWLNIKTHLIFWRASISIWKANIKIRKISKQLNRLYAEIDANNKAKGEIR